MSLTSLFKKEEDKPELFWSLVVGPSFVNSGIWCIRQDKAEMIAEGESFSYDKNDSEGAANAADSSLSAAAGALPEDCTEPKKVVFGLPAVWVDQGEIKPEVLELLKKLSQELELKPAGFVVMPEAIVHLLKTQEGTPPTVVLVGLNEESADITLVDQGKILGTTEVAKSMSLSEDTLEGLARLPRLEKYPTRILLYNHKEATLEEAKQSILEADWQKTGLSFLHTPKVETLSENVSVLAVSLAGAAEIGQAKSLVEKDFGQLEEVRQENPPVFDRESFDPRAQDRRAQTESAGGKAEEVPGEINIDEVSAEEVGFTKEEDSGRELAQKTMPIPETINYQKPKKYSLAVKLPAIHLPALSAKGGLVVLTVSLIFLALAALFSFFYLPKINIEIFVSPKKTEKEITLTNFLNAKNLEVEISVEKQRPTTGTREVGEKARGEVTVYRAGGAVTLPGGTVLEGGNGLKFTLDSDVRVEAGTAGPKAGKNIDLAKITAANIGPEYNLASGMEFTLGQLSQETITAINGEAFAGGSKRSLPAVSKNDLLELEKDVLEEAKNQAEEKILPTLSENEILIKQKTQIETLDKKGDYKEGQEAEVVSLTAKAKVKLFILPKQELLSIAKAELERDKPQGFALRQDQIAISIKDQDQEGNLKIAAVGNLLPEVNPDAVRKEIKGKSANQAREILSKIPGYTRVILEYNFKPFSVIKTIPHIEKNISIEVSAER